MKIIYGWAIIVNKNINWSTFRTTVPPLGSTGYKRVTKISCACGIDCGEEVSGDGEELFPKFQAIEVTGDTGWISFDYGSTGSPVKYQLILDGTIIFDSGYIGDDTYQAALDIYLTSKGEPLETITEIFSDSYTFFGSEGTYGVYIFAPLIDYGYSFTLGCPGTTTSTSTTLPSPQSILRLTNTGPPSIELTNFNAVLDSTNYLLGPNSSHSLGVVTNNWMGSWIGDSLDVNFDISFLGSYQFAFQLSLRIDEGPITPVASDTLFNGDSFSISGIDTSLATFKIEVLGVFTGSALVTTTSSSTTQVQTTSSTTSSTTTLQ